MGCSRGRDYSGSEVLGQDGAREATLCYCVGVRFRFRFRFGVRCGSRMRVRVGSCEGSGKAVGRF